MIKVNNTAPTVDLKEIDEIGYQYDQSSNRHDSVRKLIEWSEEQPAETWDD